MATFFCNMTVKTGTSGATASSHLAYIAREKQYAKRDQELVGCGQGNLPDFCEGNPRKFFKACEENDVRSHRSITFALPNELPPEAWQEIINAYVKEVCPELPYFYAIHQVDSAVHGERNPHVHLMFSERIVDARTKGMSEDKFFARHGVTKNGREYGGSVKTRIYAGKSSTQKIYEIREKLAEITNATYAKYNRPERISAKTLEKQVLDKKKQGGLEVEPPELLDKPRLDRETFFKYKKEIQQAVKWNESVIQMDVPDEVKERILYEQEKKIMKELDSLVQEYNQSLTSNEYIPHALAMMVEERKRVAKEFTSPFKKESPLLLMLNDQYPPVTEESFCGANIIKEDIHRYEVDQMQKAGTLAMVIADAERTLEKLRKERASLQKMTPRYVEDYYLNEVCHGKLNELDDSLLTAERQRDEFRLNGNEYAAKQMEIVLAEKAKVINELIDQIYTPEVERRVEDTIQSIEERKREITIAEMAIHNVLEPAKEIADSRELMKAQEIQRIETQVSEKHERWLADIDRKVAKQIDSLVWKYQKACEPLNETDIKASIKDNIVDELSYGKLKKLQEQLRSQKSFLKYHEEKTGDQSKAMECRREIARLEREITDMRIKYGGTIPVMREIDRRYEAVKAKYDANRDKVSKQVKRKLTTISRKQKVAQFIRNKAVNALHALATGSGKSTRRGRASAEHGLSADRIHAEEDTIRNDGNLR